jgi:hypothetical protein
MDVGNLNLMVYAQGRNLIREVILPNDKPDPFAAALFGTVYEELLEYYFKRQRFTRPNYPVWRFVGKGYMKRPGSKRRIRLDYLLEDTTRKGFSPPRPGNSAGGSRLVCFEAKSWPAYQNFHTISRSNVNAFLDENESQFLDYIKCPSWEAILEGKKEYERIQPDAFGFLVFDYDHGAGEREAILEAFKARNPLLQEIESIVDLLSMVIYNKARIEKDLSNRLKRKQRIANQLFSLFL